MAGLFLDPRYSGHTSGNALSELGRGGSLPDPLAQYRIADAPTEVYGLPPAGSGLLPRIVGRDEAMAWWQEREKEKSLEQQKQNAFDASRTPLNRLEDTGTFIVSAIPRVLTKGAYGLGDVTGLFSESTGKADTASEQRFLRANRRWLEPVAQAGEAAMGIPGLQSMGAVPGQMLRTGRAALGQVNALAGRAMPNANELANTVNIFAGPGAKTANKVALARAGEMELQGAHADEIWQATGWGRGADGKWRFEIDDSGARFTTASQKPFLQTRGSLLTTPLAEGFDHPELYDAYSPSGIKFTVQKTREMGLSVPGELYVGGPNEAVGRSVALHELQHPIQRAEGFAGGGQPRSFARELPDGGYDNGYDIYRRLAGEVEARNVQARRNMSAAERRATPPWYTEDVPRDQQLILRHGRFRNKR